MFNSFYQYIFNYNSNNSEKIINIQPGTTLNDISALLKSNGFIDSKIVFKIWIKINNLEKELKFGEYNIKKNISIGDLAKILTLGKTINRFFTIPEGFSKFQLHSKLLSNNKIPYSSQENILPDILIADTYSFTINNKFDDIIKRIKKKSMEESMTIWEARDKSIPLNSIEEMFILASIVEKETAKNSEKNKISGVFFNRLELGMRLQSDPTVIYALTKGKKLKRKLTRKDLKFKSDYNTYTTNGLPPSPICYPGIDTLRAVANPYKGDFLYFVSDKKGGHLFSIDYAGHLEKIKQLKKKKIN
ncbi:MAG: 4-amino-4-deoxychorismate lyase [Rickettsiales bacterium]|nr:4-amino-4-deoxychorismate lyase [Rickettsiales bacterium]